VDESMSNEDCQRAMKWMLQYCQVRSGGCRLSRHTMPFNSRTEVS